jgi:hypothetical protein
VWLQSSVDPTLLLETDEVVSSMKYSANPMPILGSDAIFYYIFIIFSSIPSIRGNSTLFEYAPSKS